MFIVDVGTLNEYAWVMTPNKLKKIREKLQARQSDMAKLLGVAIRTYQNWEQPKTSKAHRKIPDDTAERVQCLVELKSAQDGNSLPDDLIWLQIPVFAGYLEELKRAAWQEDKSISVFLQEALSEKLDTPRVLPESVFDE